MPPSNIYHPPQHIVPPRNDGVQSNNLVPSNSGRVCFMCGLPGNYFRQCPQVLMTPRHSRHKPSNKSISRPFPAKLPATSSGYVNRISVEEAVVTSDVILGTLPVNHVPTSILFGP